MKILLSTLLLLQATVFAQTDSSLIKVPFTYLPMGNNFLCAWASKVTVIENDSAWRIVQNRCGDTTKVDLKKNTAWQRTSHGDCHARFSHELLMDTVNKKMIWLQHNYYGGCRGAITQEFRILFPKPPAGYSFELIEKQHKRY
jgi:hypothetical protein